MDVNLLKTRVKSERLSVSRSGPDNAQADGAIQFSKTGMDEDDRKKVLTNLFLIVLFSFVAKFYSDYSKKAVLKKQQVLNVSISELQEKIGLKEGTVKEYSKYQEESEEFKKKIIVVRELSKFRLYELKALDYLQGILPEKLWFRSIDYKERVFKLKGSALEQQALSDFLGEMESSSFFHEILILKSKEDKTDQGSEVKFELQAKLKVI